MSVVPGARRTPLPASLLLPLVLAACASRPPDAAPPPPAAVAAAPAPAAAARPEQAAAAAWPQAGGTVVGRDDRLVVYRPRRGDTLGGIAARFLGEAEQAWQIAELNDVDGVADEVPLLVPLRPLNPLGVRAGSIQTVPILSYHRLGSGASKMIVSPARFEAQMAWLVEAGYRVVRLADLAGFLAGERALPRRSVVVTFDDGYASVYRHAYPVLRRLGLPATLFIYTDFLGGGDALTWAQLQEMLDSGLIDVQSHSKSHRNLTERRPDESDERYRANVEMELRVPRQILEGRLAPLRVRHLAYPFGDANAVVLDAAARQGVELAVTVVSGGNPFYGHPLLLRRTMIFGDVGLDAFKTKLQTSRPLAEP